MNKSGFDIANFGGGALAEQIDFELQKVLDNIADPNTDPKKPRKLQINLEFRANQDRNLASVSSQVKSTIVPIKPSETQIIIDRDGSGQIVAAELRGNGLPGQMEIAEDGAVKEGNGKVVNLRGGNAND